MNVLKSKLIVSTEALEKAQERLELAENRVERLRTEARAKDESEPSTTLKDVPEDPVKSETPTVSDCLGYGFFYIILTLFDNFFKA